MANKWDERKKALEDEYFVKKEKELVEKLQGEAGQGIEAIAGTDPLDVLPEMRRAAQERSFQKIAIDQCTGCGGIWLDPKGLDRVAKKEEGSWLGKFWGKEK